jgi:Fe-S-cluster containining protein
MAHVTPSDAAAIVELIDLTPELARDVAGVVFRQLEDVSARVAAGRLVAELGTFPCPLLSFDRRCRIYDFRPWACIATQSADRRACEGSAAAGKRDAWDPQEYFPVLAETYRRLSPRSLRALQHAIDQKHSGNTLPMTMALAMVLDAPAALGAALGGRKP